MTAVLAIARAAAIRRHEFRKIMGIPIPNVANGQ
jgi:hypothetical protein